MHAGSATRSRLARARDWRYHNQIEAHGLDKKLLSERDRG